MEKSLIEFLIRFRYLLAILSVLATALLASGAKNLYLESDYKIYFKENDPQLIAHEKMQDTYTKTDNLAYLIRADDGEIFTAEMLGMLHEITERSWQTPFALRVDSITNFQHTQAVGDDLLVEDLILDPSLLDEQRIAWLKKTVMSEKRLVKQAISENGSSTRINVTLQLPPEADKTADLETQTAQRNALDASHPEVVAYARSIKAEFEQRYPGVQIHLQGVSMVNNTFNESSEKDIKSLVPIMYLVILLIVAFFLRSIGSMVGTVLIIGFASVVALGGAGFLGLAINAVNVTAPMIVLTIAVCDAVHLLSVYLRSLSQKLEPVEAMRESLRLNLQPIILTSVTTAVGFLTLNFSISPPFAQLGNMTAIGVIWAMVLTFTFLPAVSILLVRKSKPKPNQDKYLRHLAHFIVRNSKACFFSAISVALLLMSFIPMNIIDDNPTSYFKKGVEFRDASEFAVKHFPALNDVEFSLDCGSASCTSDPEFLQTVADFQAWYEQQPGVLHVGTYVDIMRNLNRSMNGDDQRFHTIPERADLAAQYSLMYEMSLPYGLDLNNQLNLDKSATKITIIAGDMISSDVIRLADRGHQWLLDNYRSDAKPGSSVSLMFSHIGEKNIRSMLWGGVIAILGVTLTILIALRSFRYAIISMIPNAIPAFMAFGIWGVMVGSVNMAVAAVFSISLGILVDDTVHFISKYRRAREVKKLSPEDSIVYAFENVGTALIITTIALSVGFGLLATSDFNLNAMSGLLTMITIIIALIFDFLILPPILMFFDKKDQLQA